MQFNQSRPKTILFPGRFQPPHSGHFRSFEEAHRLLGHLLTPVVVWKRPTKESPYRPELIVEMIGAGQTDWMTTSLIASDVNLPNIVEACRRLGYEPVGVACGADRAVSYSKQAEKLASGHYDTWVLSSFKVHNVDDREHGVSSSLIREALRDGDESYFLDNSPDELHRFLPELRKFS
jgi:cytidyltransferase-like protein